MPGVGFLDFISDYICPRITISSIEFRQEERKVEEEKKKITKKILFYFDGTSNEYEDVKNFSRDGSITNILKMHVLSGGITPKESVIGGQESLYYSGVGTRGWLLERILKKIFVLGAIGKILKHAKKDLIDRCEKYIENDEVEVVEIYVFGFSRGAATGRKFAAKIKVYLEKAKSLKGKNKEKVKIKFLGVFDTVLANYKILADVLYRRYPHAKRLGEKRGLGRHIEKAVHLVALDEERIAYQPTLFNKDERVTEVWFPGAHSDVGGGFWFDGLSDIALEFMCNEAKKAGVEFLATDDVKFNNLGFKDEISDLHFGQGLWTRLKLVLKLLLPVKFLLPIKDIRKNVDEICKDDLDIRPLSKGVMHKKKRSGLFGKTLAPRLVCVIKNNQISRNEVPVVHYTVSRRFLSVTGYRPVSLRDTRYCLMGQNSDVGEVKYGIKSLYNIESFIHKKI